MKILGLFFLLLNSNFSFAKEIQGTLVLKGTLKSELFLLNKKTSCKVKVQEVKNLMEEDQYGNPAYKIKINVELSGGDFFSPDRIKFDQTAILTNLFPDGVSDLSYAGSNFNLLINSDGRLNQLRFLYKNNTVICKF